MVHLLFPTLQLLDSMLSGGILFVVLSSGSFVMKMEGKVLTAFQLDVAICT